MTVTIPSSGYMSSNTRIKGEMKTSFEQLRDAIEVIDVSTDTNTSDITTIGALVTINTNNISSHTSDSDIHVTLPEKAKLIYGPIYIGTQSEFDSIFSGGTISNAYIFISDNTTTYLLNSNVPFGSNVLIDADPGVVIERNGQYKFSSIGTVGTPITNVHFTDKWIFDGQGGVNTFYGGTTTYAGNGGFCELDYITNSKFECFVTNCKVTNDGGAYHATNTVNFANIKIKNVYKNEAGGSGGGIYGVGYSDISNITYNIAQVTSTTLGGGGVSDCLKSKINNIHNNSTPNGSGGGVTACTYSIISNISNNNSNNFGGGVYGSTNSTISNVYNNASAEGGGVSNSTNSTISNVYSNVATGGGGGVFLCEHSTIKDIHNNAAPNSDGGGVSQCVESNISVVYSNTADNGGGVYNCDLSTVSDVYFNTAHVNGGGIYGGANLTISTVYRNNALYNGGGIYGCNYSTMTNIYFNYTTADGNTNYGGGGIYDCDYCNISNVHDNIAGNLSTSSITSGGGLMNCNYCTISNVFNNACGSYGGGLCACVSCTITDVRSNRCANTGGGVVVGGAYYCNYSIFLGDWTGNIGNVNHIYSAINSIANVSQGTGTVAGVDYIISTTRSTINW